MQWQPSELNTLVGQTVLWFFIIFYYLDCTKCKFPDFSLTFPNNHFFPDFQQNSLTFPWLLPILEFPWLFPDRWTPCHKDFVMGNVGKLSVKLMLTVLTNLTPNVYVWTCTIWMTPFTASRKLSGNSEQVFINQLNFRPTSIGKHNSMGRLLPCAIDFKTNHPAIHLQWIGILGMATE